MNTQDKDERLTQALRQGTEGAAQRKRSVWHTVFSRISTIEAERKRKDMKRKRNFWLSAAVTTAAAAAVTVFFSMTPQGTALADRIVKLFAPEIQMDTQIEGGTETQQAELHANTTGEMGYVIYIDTERYKKEGSAGVDTYKALNMPEGYPPVQMEIRQITDKGAQQQYEALLAEVKGKYDVAEGRGQVTEPVKGWAILAYDEDDSKSPYEDIYIVDNKRGGSFEIRCKMFREAAEGHGARFYAMLKTFQVVDSSQVETGKPEPTKKPEPTATKAPAVEQKKLTWDDLAIYGVKLDTEGKKAVEALTKAIGSDPTGDKTGEDVGGTSRTVKWADGTTAVVRNGKLYSIESTAEKAEQPFGLHAGMELSQFTAVLGEPHEAIGALAWGVGSNDNLIVKVKDGVVTSMMVSLIE